MVCSCDYSIRGHSVASLRNDVLVFDIVHDDDILLVSCAHHNGVRVACDILVCVYDIPVFCYNLHVAYNVHNYDGWVVDSELAHDERDNAVYELLHDKPDNEAYALPHDAAMDSVAWALPCAQDNGVVGQIQLGSVLLTPLPTAIRK